KAGGDQPSLRWQKPRLVVAGEKPLAVRSVSRGRRSILGRVEEAFVTFDVWPRDRDVPPWRVLGPDESNESDGDVAFIFTSALPLERNLRDFAAFASR